MDGFWIDQVDPQEKEIPDGKRVTGTLMRCEAWLNGALGIGLVTGNGHLHVIDAKVASNGRVESVTSRTRQTDGGARVTKCTSRPSACHIRRWSYSGRSIGFGAPFWLHSVVDPFLLALATSTIAACLPSACKP